MMDMILHYALCFLGGLAIGSFLDGVWQKIIIGIPLAILWVWLLNKGGF